LRFRLVGLLAWGLVLINLFSTRGWRGFIPLGVSCCHVASIVGRLPVALLGAHQ
jgi:hypothetical protein